MAERVMRSKEERIAELDKKIAFHKEKVTMLEAKKEAILNPKPRGGRKKGMNTVLSKAKEMGMTPDEIAEKLGISLDD